MCTSMSPRRPVFSGTSTRPARAIPNQSPRYSGRLPSMTATRSPLTSPRSPSAFATRFAVSSRPPYVRASSSKRTISRSGCCSARVARTEPIVHSPSYTAAPSSPAVTTSPRARGAPRPGPRGSRAAASRAGRSTSRSSLIASGGGGSVTGTCAGASSAKPQPATASSRVTPAWTELSANRSPSQSRTAAEVTIVAIRPAAPVTKSTSAGRNRLSFPAR